VRIPLLRRHRNHRCNLPAGRAADHKLVDQKGRRLLWLARRADGHPGRRVHLYRILVQRNDAQRTLIRLDPLWGELFPAEQARVVRALVERVVVGPAGADIRLRAEGLAGLVRDLGAGASGAERAAA